jgi:hypothetical protein
VGSQVYLFLPCRREAGGEGGCDSSRSTKTLGTFSQSSGTLSSSLRMELHVWRTRMESKEFCFPYRTLLVRRQSRSRRKLSAWSHLFQISHSVGDSPPLLITQSFQIFHIWKRDSETRMWNSHVAPRSCRPFSSFIMISPQPRIPPRVGSGHTGCFLSQSSFAASRICLCPGRAHFRIICSRSSVSPQNW